MSIHTPRRRTRSFAVLLTLTLGVIQLQLATAGSASASAACNGAFSGNPQGSLAISASVPTNHAIQPGDSITVTATWDTADWSGLDAYYNCWQLNGSAVGGLELEEKPPANDGSVVQTVTVPNTVSDGDTLCVRSRLSGQPAGGNTTTQKSNKLCWTVNTAPPPQPDVKITKTASKGSVNAGDSFSYTLKVENVSGTDATDVVITDKIPASLTIGTLPAGCSKAGQDITCNVGNLAAGNSKSYDIPVTTSDGSCPSVDNTGKVTATNDSNPNNNQDSASVDVACATPQPNVKIEKTASTGSVNAGDGFDWNLKVTNTSNVKATNVVITDDIDASLTIGSLPNGCSKSGQTVTCTVGDLAAGASVTKAISVTTSDASCPSVDNTGTVTATGDTDSSDDSDSASVDVTCPNPDVAIRKSSDAPVEGVFSGDPFTYTITVENVSSGDVNDVVVHDSIPAGLDITGTDSSCSVSGQNVACDLGTVAAGDSETVTITVKTTDAACPEVTNTATVTASNDSHAANDTSDPVTDIVNCREPGVAVRITKENDANNDGRYSDSEEAKRSGLDVPFRLVITNTGEEPVVLTDLTDTFPGNTIDLLGGQCSSLDGKALAPGESVKCLFTVRNYSPNPDAGAKVNTAEVCVQRDGGSSTDCDDDTSKVTSNEVLGRTITPPPTKTPPSGVAFTGSAGTLSFGLIAMALLLFGTGVMYAGYRKRQRYDG